MPSNSAGRSARTRSTQTVPAASAAPTEPLEIYGGQYAQVPLELAKNSAISAEAFRLYVILMGYARQFETCWPRHATLAADMGSSERSIRNWLKELEDSGVIEIERRREEGMPNLYHLRVRANRAENRNGDSGGSGKNLPEGRNNGAGGVGNTVPDGRQEYSGGVGTTVPEGRHDSAGEAGITVPEGRKKRSHEVHERKHAKIHDPENTEIKAHTHADAECVVVKYPLKEEEIRASENNSAFKDNPEQELVQEFQNNGFSGIAAQKLARLMVGRGRTLAELRQLLESARSTGRIENLPAYISHMIELDQYRIGKESEKGQNTRQQKTQLGLTVPPEYPFQDFTPGFHDNPGAIERRMKNLREVDALTPEREKELNLRLEWARRLYPAPGKNGSQGNSS